MFGMTYAATPHAMYRVWFNLHCYGMLVMGGVSMGGVVVANQVKMEVAQKAEQMRKDGIVPCLATILAGDDPASGVYVRNKHAACKNAGIATKDYRLPSDTSQKDLEALVADLNRNDAVHGILVQLPLPPHLDEFAATSIISRSKDVDGLTPASAGLLASGRARLVACTPLGIMRMLQYYDIPLAGKHAVIINRSSLVGKPLYHLMLQDDATVTICHSKTKNLNRICRSADIIVTGVGNGRFTLGADMVGEGAVVIDVAINRINGRLSGDAEYDAVLEKASYVTPVPGGVGPMTVAMLLHNTVVAAQLGP